MTYTLILKDGKRFDRIPIDEVKRLLTSEGYSPASVENLVDRAIRPEHNSDEETWIRRLNKLCAEVEYAIRMVRERSREIDRELFCLFNSRKGTNDRPATGSSVSSRTSRRSRKQGQAARRIHGVQDDAQDRRDSEDAVHSVATEKRG